MANLLPLDQAADAVGKSEVTIRRLIRAGKIPFQKEKTLTGFIYLLDIDKIREYYKIRSGGLYDKEGQPEPASQEYKEKIRLAVTDESGASVGYWQKRAEKLEDKWHSELVAHAQTRQELGLWRGRAEQAQALLLKLLPGPERLAAPAEKIEKLAKKEEEQGWWLTGVVVALVVLILVAAAVYVYFKVLPH